MQGAAQSEVVSQVSLLGHRWKEGRYCPTPHDCRRPERAGWRWRKGVESLAQQLKRGSLTTVQSCHSTPCSTLQWNRQMAPATVLPQRCSGQTSQQQLRPWHSSASCPTQIGNLLPGWGACSSPCGELMLNGDDCTCTAGHVFLPPTSTCQGMEEIKIS